MIEAFDGTEAFDGPLEDWADAVEERWVSRPQLDVDPVEELQPVDVRHERDHPFEKGEKRGCAHLDFDDVRCGRAKDAMVHVGVPQSLNVHGSSAHWYSYQGQKKNWSARLAELLDWSGLPRGLAYVYVEGQVCFPDRRKRDQGNFRFLLEKSLGDTLVSEGYIEDDDWSRYEFGNLRRAYEKGECWTALTLFPSRRPRGSDG